ncbi:ABC transporter substrate-binding protein [Candidatus Enterococcus lemimoniae]|uniref:Multiple sugar transport system substrate-binding protein n=1 Tax=Candidatus Enterococcus lemimoniae TaxID=1834167 RepID=A0ABZ2T7I8_9ENTE|nr:ABC transporter substrate-binding protein [Enterococcus sp. 12C11_DIV0727]OTO70759.1 hypothetical protein A5866_002996 [Enterococcus sp. 12C11_DIV0727]
MKKVMNVLSVMSILLGISLVLTGCGNTKNTDSKESGSEKTQIEYWYGLGSEADKKMKEIIQEFNDSQDKYEVKAVPQADYAETYQKLQAAIASKTAPGLAILGNSYLADLGSKNVLEPLDSYLKEDKEYNESDFLKVFMEQAKVNDSVLGVPAYGTTQVMYYRKDLLEKAGISPTEAFSSWENLIAASKKIKEENIAEIGFEPMWGQDNLIDISLSNGGTILDKDQKKVTISTSAWIDSWEMIRKAIHEDKVMSINSGGQGWEYWYKTIDDVTNGKSVGYLGSSGDKGNLDFSIIDSAEQPGVGSNQAKPIASALYLAIPSSIDKKEKEAAYAFIHYFTQSKVQADWSETIGYIPVKESTLDNEDYAKFLEEKPYYAVPFKQAQHASPAFIDPTGGKIVDALKIAADQVELENVPAKQALSEAQKKAQEALDQINKK